jgi:hypothetical protein
VVVGFAVAVAVGTAVLMLPSAAQGGAASGLVTAVIKSFDTRVWS